MYRAPDLANLRILVAAAGERTVPAWWPSQFFSAAGERWMSRVFPRTEFVARATAASLAAARVHEAALGGFDRFHLFRMPPDLERAVEQQIGKLANEVTPADLDELMNRLRALAAGEAAERTAGPILLGPTSDLASITVVGRLAGIYEQALRSGNRVYPYFQDSQS